MSSLIDEIQYGDAQSGNFPIALPALDAVDGLEIDSERVADVRNYVRATAGDARDLGNTTVSISFSVTRLHASPVAARKYLLDRAKALGALAAADRALTLRYSDSALVYTSPLCALRKYQGRAIGATTIHQVALVGAPIQ